MSVPAIPGHVLNSVIPNMFKKELIVKRYETGLLPNITNSSADSTGIKQMGDEVTFTRLPDTTVKTYTKGMDMEMERLEATTVTLTVDRAKYFYFGSDAVDLKQYLHKDIMDRQLDDANAKMEEAIITQFLASVYAGASAYNKGATAGVSTASFDLGATLTPIAVTKTSIVDQIAELAGVMDEQHQSKDLYLVLPSHFKVLLQQSELKNTNESGKPSSMIQEYMGQLHGFDIYSTTHYTRISDSGHYAYPILFGHKDAICYVEQLTEMKYFDKLEKQSGEAMRGLNVYDWKVIDPLLLGVWYAYKA